MKTRLSVFFMVSAWLFISLAGCQYFKKKVPPHEMFKKAEQLRKGNQLVEAAQEYDRFFKEYEDTELAPAALYFSGICKFSVALQCPGTQEFEEKKETLSEGKKEEYQQCLEYMEEQNDSFSLYGVNGKYLYTGHDFEMLVNSYPTSDYVDDAAFHLLRAQRIIRQQESELTVALALELYKDFFKNYPQSSFRQKGIEDVLTIVSNDRAALKNPAEVAASYHALAQTAEQLPELSKLAYLLAVKCLEAGDVDSAAAILKEPNLIGFGVVQTQSTPLNIRAGEGTRYQIVGKADKGERVLLLNRSGEWYYVHLEDGARGYANAPYIQELQ